MIDLKVSATRVLNTVLNPLFHREAQTRTLNELAGLSRKITHDFIVEGFNYRDDVIKIKIEPATIYSQKAKLIASRRPYSIMLFGAVETSRGVKAFIKRKRPTTWKKSFIAQGKAPAVMAFQRKTSKAYPLRKLTTASIGQLMRSRPNMDKINAMIGIKHPQLYMKHLRMIEF